MQTGTLAMVASESCLLAVGRLRLQGLVKTHFRERKPRAVQERSGVRPRPGRSVG